VDIVVRAEGKARAAVCEFVREPNHRLPEEWRGSLSGDVSVKQNDSIEFLESALSKWRLYEIRGRIGRSPVEFEAQIKREKYADVLGMFVINAPWSSLKGSIGFCQFRRTWCHNLAIDFIAVHPMLLVRNPPISGIGTALLHEVAVFARHLETTYVWLETTDLSVKYYSGLFGTSPASDLLRLPTAEFYEKLHSKFDGHRVN
jgi:hypothetical protein